MRDTNVIYMQQWLQSKNLQRNRAPIANLLDALPYMTQNQGHRIHADTSVEIANTEISTKCRDSMRRMRELLDVQLETK